MKILIMSITAGEGHNSTAKALASCFEERGITCDILDTFEYISKLLGKTVDSGYLAATKKLQKPYASVYRMLENRKHVQDDRSTVRMSNALIAKKMYKYLCEYSPDAIIVTHCFAAVLLDVINSKFGVHCPTYGIVTDFAAHPFWEEATSLSYIVTASELLDVQMKKKGFRQSQLLPLGIPIRSKFATKMSKAEARAKHGLDADKFTVLLMSGSMGFGNIESTVLTLDRVDLDFQMVIVCGRNEKAKESIEKLQLSKKSLCLGFVDYIDELMDCADCFISKPGGLTTSEALAKELPIIIVNPIPGIEDRNTEFLTNNGVAMRVSSTAPLDEVIYQCFRFPEKLENMRSNIRLIKHPDSARELCLHIINEVGKQNEQ